MLSLIPCTITPITASIIFNVCPANKIKTAPNVKLLSRFEPNAILLKANAISNEAVPTAYNLIYEIISTKLLIMSKNNVTIPIYALVNNNPVKTNIDPKAEP